MSKIIKNHFELKDVCRSAGLWFVGSFTMELIIERHKWENPDTKNDFISYFYNEYMKDLDKHIDATTTRINCCIRIIESKLVEDAMELVIDANDVKLGCEESKVNAKFLLDEIKTGKIKY